MAEQDHISFNQPWISPAILQQMNPNNRIGRYQIIKTLGEGSFGKVKLAFHLTTGQRVALKIINRKTLAKSDMQGRIEREISYLRLLRHPHIIKLYDVIKSKEEIIMVMEFAGGELFDYIVQKGVMKESDARRFFVQIICAVQYCHRHKIVHRDLKPENLLLDENLNIKIADFGLSNLMTDGNFLKTSCGSPNYAAPEVISGKLYAGSEVDVWSCGVILYVMLCGRLPFDDDFIPALFKKISSGVFVIPSFLSPGAKELIQKMLIVDPLNRITIDQVMENEWFNVDFPDYLRTETINSILGAANSGQGSTADHGLIDEEIAKNLISTMGYNSEEVFDVLKQKYIDHKEGLDSNEIVNAYDLLVENKKYTSFMNEHSPDDNKDIDTVACKLPPSWNKDGNQNFVNTYDLSPLADTTNPQETPVQNTISILPSSIPQYHRAFMLQKYPEIFQKVTPASTKKLKIRWHFGIRSKSYPLDVMGEIYRALKNLGTQWLKPTEEDLWTIKVRWKCNPQKGEGNLDEEQDGDHLGSKFTFGDHAQRERKDGDVVMEGVEEDQGLKPVEAKKLPDFMKMQIQLFQLEANNYLVDFKFDGWEFASTQENENVDKYFEYESGGSDQLNSYSAYPFLHMATRLIMELAVNSQN